MYDWGQAGITFEHLGIGSFEHHRLEPKAAIRRLGAARHQGECRS